MHEAKNKYLVDENGEQWVRPPFQFNTEQWKMLSSIFDMVRRQLDDQTITNSKVVEYLAAEYIAHYGVDEEYLEKDIKLNNVIFIDEKLEHAIRSSRSKILIVEPLKEENKFRVFNPTNNNSYLVCKLEDGWLCNCPDSKYRKLMCKHIISVEKYLENIQITINTD